MANMITVMVMIIMAPSLGPKRVGAQPHQHVVGDDRGWDTSSDIATWSSGQNFRVGDKIWFAYAAAQESIVELKSKDEYESCDLRNPIRMYTDGLDSIELVEEGIRYFVSSKSESCQKGLKLHVEVMPSGNPDTEMPKVAASENSVLADAVAPTTPSGSNPLSGNSMWLFIGLWLCICIAI
ncbi:umecyanin-like [Hibiscus syriacus]|uniref:umecyanin-like n=1 Tax=Hibiscus syriacus TaxID=106335 RepID=UPI0019204046|nr:umecyanin-like [Hibiscus syriacus]